MKNINIKRLIFLIFLKHLPLFANIIFEQNLRQHLFQNYSSYIRPVKNPHDAINVSFNIKLMQVLSVDERDQKVTTQVYYSMRWKNEFLVWDPKKWGNIDLLLVKPNKVWIPDIILKNNADSNAATVQENTDTVWVMPNGEIAWYPKLMLTSSFKANVKNFPFDRQKFIFHFGSWSQGEKKLLIQKDDKSMKDKYYVHSTEWDLVRMRKTIVRSPYDTDRYSEIVFEYLFARKSSYCVITAILPCFMLMSIVLSSYLLPPNCGERIGVLITAILAFTVFLQVVNSSLPRNSDSIPTLKLFYLITMAECSLCFLATCIAIRLLNKRVENTIPNLPRWMTRYICQKNFGSLGPIVRRSQVNFLSCNDNGGSEIILLDDNTFMSVKRGRSQTLNTAFLVDGKTDSKVKSERQRMTTEGNESDNDISQKNSDKKLANEIAWKLLVEYLDKLCMYVFFVMFLLTSFGILLPAQYTYDDDV